MRKKKLIEIASKAALLYKQIEMGEEKYEKVENTATFSLQKGKTMSSITQQSWEDFQKAGLLWFVNQFLQVFGWAICLDVDNGIVKKAYPGRVLFRGFTEEAQTICYERLARYIRDHGKEIYDEAEYKKDLP